MNSLAGVAAPSNPVGSILVKILHSVEGGDVEKVCSNLETILPCLGLLISPFLSLSLSLSLSHTLVFIYLACLYCSYLYMLDILVLN